MECPKEIAASLEKRGWYQRGNGMWSHEKDGHKHRTWEEVIPKIIENHQLSDEKQAVKVETNIDGLSISIGDDGLWLNFSVEGRHASTNLSLQHSDAKGIIDNTILEWCKATAKKYCA
jgi:hypothetical protein